MDWSGLLRDISLIIVSWSAIYGIDSWRREYRGKRQIELAEDTLALFYQAQDIINWIRYPLSSADEGKSREVIDEETESAIGDVHWIIGLQTISCMISR